jgi:hypothetical protein
LALPLVFDAAFSDEEQIIDHGTDWNVEPYFEHAWHGERSTHPIVRVPAHRRRIVGDNNAPFLSCPREERGVIDARQPNVLNSDDVEIRPASKQASGDVVVEILVGRQPNHDGLPAPCQETFTHTGPIGALLVVLPNAGSVLLTLRDVGTDLGSVMEIVSDDGVDIGQGQRRILLDDFFGGGAGFERCDDRIERDARTGNANDAVGVGLDRNPISRLARAHLSTPSPDYTPRHGKRNAALGTASICPWSIARTWLSLF